LENRFPLTRRAFTLLLATALSICPSAAFSFDTFEDRTLGYELVNSGTTSDFFAAADEILVDGQITSYPPDLTTYDRTLITMLKIGTNINLNEKFGLRFISDTRFNMRKAYEEKEPRNVTEENWLEIKPTLDLTFRAASGIEFFAGGKAWYLPKHKRTTDSINFTAKESFDPAFLFIPRGGLLKRSQYVTGGVYYEKGDETSRDIVKEASDGSKIKADETVYDPTVLGLFFRFNLWNCPIDSEFNAVQASEGGPETQEGKKILEDYTRFRLGVLIPWDKNSLNYQFVLIHKTISYAESSFISLDTIPLTTAHFKMISGSEARNYFVGLTYGQGDDTQSIPEFNARYRIKAYGAKLGLNYRF